MHQRTLLILSLWLLSLQAMPQPVINTPGVDQQTYLLYLEKDWDGLIEAGKTALHHDIDFYYLRFRIGIAYYHKGNFLMATHHLQKAFQDNPRDPLLKEYLYFSLAFTNRIREARMVAGTMTGQQRELLDISNPGWIDQLDFSYNRNFARNDDLTDDFVFDETAANGFQFLSKGHSYFSLNLSHPVSERISIYHGYTHISKTHYIYSRNNGIPTFNPEATSGLNQYYFSMNALLAPGLSLVTAAHAINISYRLANAGAGRRSQRASGTEYLGALSIYQQLPYITLGASGYYAGLNDASQLQGDLMVALYPLGNLNLYAVSTLSLQAESTDGTQDLQRQVFFQRLGGRLSPTLWLEAFATTGDMQNLMRYDGLVVFNTLDKITRQLGIKMTGILAPGLGFSIDYSHFVHESTFSDANAPGQELNTKEYNSHSITGGLLWNF